MTNQTQFTVWNKNPGPNQYIYVYLATYDDIKDGNADNLVAHQIAATDKYTRTLKPSDGDDGAIYLALTFHASNTPGTGVASVIYVGKSISNPSPASSLIRELKVPEGFVTTLSVSPDGFSMTSERLPQT